MHICPECQQICCCTTGGDEVGDWCTHWLTDDCVEEEEMKIKKDCSACSVDEWDDYYCSEPKHPGNFGAGFDCERCRDYAKSLTKFQIAEILKRK